MRMELDSMKYAELRNLAKELGLKANMKADKLLRAIKLHYEQEGAKDEGAQGQESDTVRADEDAAPDIVQGNQGDSPKTAVFVNTRRGRRNCTKRECPAEADDPAGSCDTQRSAGAKKSREASPGRDPAMVELEPQPAAGDQQRPDAQDKVNAERVYTIKTFHVLTFCSMDISNTEKAPKLVKGGKIPRYQGLQQKSKPLLKPITPNFKKLHEAQFSKMESIDSYVLRKIPKNPIKDLKKNPARSTMFSPVSVNKTPAEEKRQHYLLSGSKIPSIKPGKEGGQFRPSVLSTRRINVRFSEATLDNEFKRSLVKTPARMSPLTSSTPQKQTGGVRKSSIKPSGISAQKSAGPFVFTGNTSALATPGSQKKPAFDLKASLSRPLNYKPHKGKLKPFGDVKENAAGNKSVIANPRQESYKQPKILSREDRRTRQVESRKQKKESMLGARRGLVMM
ncbi:nucleolar and spindle-associated protein 1 [Fundulus diaphanus]